MSGGGSHPQGDALESADGSLVGRGSRRWRLLDRCLEGACPFRPSSLLLKPGAHACLLAAVAQKPDAARFDLMGGSRGGWRHIESPPPPESRPPSASCARWGNSAGPRTSRQPFPACLRRVFSSRPRATGRSLARDSSEEPPRGTGSTAERAPGHGSRGTQPGAPATFRILPAGVFVVDKIIDPMDEGFAFMSRAPPSEVCGRGQAGLCRFLRRFP